MNAESTPKCPQCGAPLPPDAPDGLCPKCVMALNLKTETIFSSEAAPTQPPLTPEQLAPHFPQLEILEYLGRGGMGVVYKARQKTLNRIVALKLLAPERVHDPEFASRFTREAQALAALNHPNIVTIHDFGQAGGFYFLLMEYVDGVNLRHLLRARKFTPEEALTIVPPLCDALQYAHERGIVHRDIKPENILLDKGGRVKVADFGIAKMLANGHEATGTAASGDNVTRSAMGTPGYSAPEQQADPRRVDSRADIYSLGVVFYEMLTGELPGKKIEPPSKKVSIDVRLDEIVLRALEQKPELRYQQASILKTQVETIGSAIPLADKKLRPFAITNATPFSRFIFWCMWPVFGGYFFLLLNDHFNGTNEKLWHYFSYIFLTFAAICGVDTLFRIRRGLKAKTPAATVELKTLRWTMLLSGVLAVAVVVYFVAIPGCRKRALSFGPVIERIDGAAGKASITGWTPEGSRISFNLGKNQGWLGGCDFTNATRFTASLERNEDGARCVIRDAAGNNLFNLAVQQSGGRVLARGDFVFDARQETVHTRGPIRLGEWTSISGEVLPVSVILQTRDEKPKPPSPPPPPQLSFSPVVERVMPVGSYDTATSWLDLDSGQISALPAGTYYRKYTKLPMLGAFMSRNKTYLVAPGQMFFAWIPKLQWETAGPLEVKQKAPFWQSGIPISEDLDNRASSLMILSATNGHNIFDMVTHGFPADEKSDVFVFRTIKGTIGLLQITGFTENPRGVKIRYKLVQAEPESRIASGWTSNESPAPDSLEGELRAQGKRWVKSGGQIVTGAFVQDTYEGRLNQPKGRGAIGKVLSIQEGNNGQKDALVDFGRGFKVNIHCSELALVRIVPAESATPAPSSPPSNASDHLTISSSGNQVLLSSSNITVVADSITLGPGKTLSAANVKVDTGTTAVSGSTPSFELRWVAAAADSNAPVDILRDNEGRKFAVLKPVVLTSADVESAGFSEYRTEQKTLEVFLGATGRDKFARATAQHIGRQLAIVWQGKVLSAPVVQSEIPGGRVAITGRFTDAEAQQLLDVLNHRAQNHTASRPPVYYDSNPLQEPSYQGKTLLEWLGSINCRSDLPNTLEQPREAIRQMGTNVIPFLLADLGNANPLHVKYSRQDFRSGDDRSCQAVWAFDALGAEGKSAIPELEKLLPSNPGYVPGALAGIGRDALPVLLQALTNDDFWVRDNTAAYLANAINRGKFSGHEAIAALPIAERNLSYTNSTNNLYEANTRSRAKALFEAIRNDPSLRKLSE